MYSEIDNLLNGKVVVTPEFEISKKAIGISTANLQPNEQGIIPLGKQNAFIKEEKKEQTEMVDFGESSKTTSTQEEIENFDWNNFFNKKPEESMSATDLPKIDEGGIPAPSTADVVLDNPVEVENIQAMNSLKTESNLVEEVDPVEEIVEEKEEIPVMEMPTMPEEVVASEPTNTATALFETPAFDPVPEIAPVMPEPEPVQQSVEPVVEAINIPTNVPTESAPDIEPAVPISTPVEEVQKAEPIELNIPSKTAPVPEKKADGVYISNENLKEIANIIRDAANKVASIIESSLKVEQTETLKEDMVPTAPIPESPAVENINNELPETKDAVNNVMNDALNQIQNMVMPVVSENGTLKM